MASCRFRYTEESLDCRLPDPTPNPSKVVGACKGDYCCSFAAVGAARERTAHRWKSPSCSHWDKETREDARRTSLLRREMLLCVIRDVGFDYIML